MASSAGAHVHGHLGPRSRCTLRALLEEAGFGPITFHRVGPVPPLAKAMVAVARRP